MAENPIIKRIDKGNRFITALIERCLSEITTATSLVKIKQAWEKVPAQERIEWLKAFEDNALADIANLANQFHIVRLGEMAGHPRYKSISAFFRDTSYQVQDYRNAFHHPEDFEAPQLEWNSIIPIHNNIQNGVYKAQQFFQSKTGKNASDARNAIKRISQMLEEHPVYDPAAMTPEIFDAALNTAIQFNETKTGAYLSACRKKQDQLHFDAASFDGDRSTILPFEFDNALLQAFTEKRRRNAHAISGPVSTSTIIESFKSTEHVQQLLEKILRQRGAAVPEIENPITQFAAALPAPNRGGGKPMPPPDDTSVMSRHPTFWQDRIAEQEGLGRFPLI